jgi:hypothetical protein
VAATAGYENYDDKKAVDYDNNFKRLHEVACLNYVYPVTHNLKDYGIMKEFMTSGSLTQERGPEGVPGRGGTSSYPGEGIMIVYDARPHPGRSRICSLSPGTPTRCG